MPMGERSIVDFLKAEVEPIADVRSKEVYRASVYLRDQTYLPCVTFRRSSDMVDLALKRFEEMREKQSHPSLNYQAVVKVFVTGRNRVAPYDIEHIEKSPFSIPAQFRRRLWSAGETRMSYVSFVGIMDDRNEYWFTSPFELDFFEMPAGYTGDRIVDVKTHTVGTGEPFKTKPSFDCCLDEL